MDVFKIEVNNRNVILARQYFHSLKELSKKADLQMVTGSIPDRQKITCLKLPDFISLLNGSSVRVGNFDFTPGDWPEPVVQPVHYTNNHERARAIRQYIREELLSGNSVSVSDLMARFPGLRAQTMRRHLTKVSYDINEERTETELGRLIIKRDRNIYAPIHVRDEERRSQDDR